MKIYYFGQEQYELTVRGEVTYHSPIQSSFGGGNEINLYGRGFGPNMTVEIFHEFDIESNLCKEGCHIHFVSSSFAKLTVPPLRGAKGKEFVRAFILLSVGENVFKRIEFTYENGKTARITSLRTEYTDFVRKRDLVYIIGEHFDPDCTKQTVYVGHQDSTCQV